MGLRKALNSFKKRASSMLDLYGPRRSSDYLITDIEFQRQRRYLIRAHYADPGAADDGITDCPLYYASIEGLGGDSSENLATMKRLPKKGAPPDYRMVSLANWVPLACEYDVSCMVNDFNLDKIKIVKPGEKIDKKRTEFFRKVLKESEAKNCFSIASAIFQGASRGDVYIRARLEDEFTTGVGVYGVPAESVFPILSKWNERMPEAYRIIYRMMDIEADKDTGRLLETGVWNDYVELLGQDGTKYFKGNEQIQDRSGDHGVDIDEIPMVHIGYRDCDSFFGTPAIDGELVSSIDNVNVTWSHLDNVMMVSFGLPVVFLFGVSETSKFAWGRRLVHGLPKEAKVEILSFKELDKLLDVAKKKDEALRLRIPQLVLLELRNASSIESGVALTIRLYSYSAYLGKIEQQFTRGLNDLARIVFKLKGMWADDDEAEVVVDWGDRFPQDVMDQVKELEARIKAFGKIGPVIRRAAKEAGYDDAEVELIVSNLERDNNAELANKETSAAGGGLGGATIAAKQRAGPVGQPTPASPVVPGSSSATGASPVGSGVGSNPVPPINPGA